MEANLTRRVLSAVVLVPAVVAGVAWLPPAWFALAAGAFVLAAAWEWAGIAGAARTRVRSGYALATATLLGAAWLAITGAGAGPVLFAAGLGWWAVALGWVVRYQQGDFDPAAVQGAPMVLAGWACLVPAWGALVWLHQASPGLVLYLLVLIWVADTGAFFAGRRWGVTRLAAAVSPGKSWEGVAGAVVAVGAFAVAIALARGMVYGCVVPFVLLTLSTAVLSVLGDLTESLFKRVAGVKDSGALIPGHGGVLDRVDSLLAAAPCFALGVIVMGDFW